MATNPSTYKPLQDAWFNWNPQEVTHGDGLGYTPGNYDVRQLEKLLGHDLGAVSSFRQGAGEFFKLPTTSMGAHDTGPTELTAEDLAAQQQQISSYLTRMGLDPNAQYLSGYLRPEESTGKREYDRVLYKKEGDQWVPVTGYDDPTESSWNDFRDSVKAVAPIALSFIPGIGATLGNALGATGAWAPIVGNTTLSGGLTALQGGDIGDVLKAALGAGITSGVTQLNPASGLGLTGGMANAVNRGLGSVAGAALRGGDVGDALVGALLRGGMSGLNSLSNSFSGGYDPSDLEPNSFPDTTTQGGGMDWFDEIMSDIGIDSGSISYDWGQGSGNPLYSLGGGNADGGLSVNLPDVFDSNGDVDYGFSDNPNNGQGLNISDLGGTWDNLTSYLGDMKPNQLGGLAGLAKQILGGAGSLLGTDASGMGKLLAALLPAIAAYQDRKQDTPAVGGGYTTPIQAQPVQRNITQGKYGPIAQYQFAGGGYLKGPGDGMSDGIPALIDGGEPAKLATGEFVFPADVVAAVGNGDNDAGAQKLYQMLDEIREFKYGRKEQPPAMGIDALRSAMLG